MKKLLVLSLLCMLTLNAGKRNHPKKNKNKKRFHPIPYPELYLLQCLHEKGQSTPKTPRDRSCSIM
jgi:hypothetical protein